MSQAATIAPLEAPGAAQASVMDAIQGRRSVRSYRKTRVGRAAILTLLEAAVRAPTAMHGEPWTFLAIQDPDVLARLSARAKASLVEEVKRLPPEQRRARDGARHLRHRLRRRRAQRARVEEGARHRAGRRRRRSGGRRISRGRDAADRAETARDRLEIAGRRRPVMLQAHGRGGSAGLPLARGNEMLDEILPLKDR